MPADLLEGGREPDAADPRPVRRWPQVLLVVVLVLAATAWGLHRLTDRSDEASARPAVSRSPTGPPLRLTPPGVPLLVLASSPLLINPSTGVRQVLSTGANGDPGSVQRAVALRGGAVLGFSHRGGGLDVIGARPGAPPVSLGFAEAVLDAHDGRSVWLTGAPTATGTEVRRVTLSGSPAGAVVRLPPGQRPVAATGDDDLVVGSGSGSTQRLSLVGPSGTRLLVAHADVVFASSGAVLVQSTVSGALSILGKDTYYQPDFAVLLPGALAGPVVLSADGGTIAAVVHTGGDSLSIAAGRTDGNLLSIVPGTRSTGFVLDPQLTHDGGLVLGVGHTEVVVISPVLQPTRQVTVALPEFAATLSY